MWKLGGKSFWEFLELKIKMMFYFDKQDTKVWLRFFFTENLLFRAFKKIYAV